MKRIYAYLAMGLLFSGYGYSQAESDELEATPYYEKLNFEFQVNALSHDLMGDKLDVSSGVMRFEYVDIDIQGNSSLKVELRRIGNSPRTNDSVSQPSAFEFGYWNFEVPRLTWATPGLLNPDAPIRAPIALREGNYCSGDFSGGFASYRKGYQLIVPGVVNEQVIENNNTLIGASDAKYVTKSKWKVRCAGVSGSETFEAVSPEGNKYTFDKKVLSDPIAYASEGGNNPVNVLMFFVSKVEDRFGNWVQYTYDGDELSTISSNDGRLIEINRTDDGVTATANGRTWTYSNDGNRVDLPDGRFWSYSFYRDDSKQNSITYLPFYMAGNHAYLGGCEFSESYGVNASSTIGTSHLDNYPYPPYSTPTTIASPENAYIEILHPDGATGKFWLGRSRQGQTNVSPHYRLYTTTYSANNPRCVYMPSLIKKSIEYKQGNEYTWHYQHSNNSGTWGGPENTNWDSHLLPQSETDQSYIDSFLEEDIHLPSNVDNQNYKILKIINPDSSYTMHYVNRNFQSALQDKVVATAYFDADHVLLKEELSGYVSGTEWGTMSTGLEWYSTDKTKLYKPVLTSFRTILYDDNGTTSYIKELSNLDNYDVPQQIAQYNTANSYARYIKYQYRNDTQNWLLSLPSKTYISNSSSFGATPTLETNYHSLTVGNADYDGLSLPYEKKRFGTWNTRYTQYFNDGNANKIEYNQLLVNSSGVEQADNYRYIITSAYKRGQPTLFTYPARYSDSGTLSQSQTIDDNGWVTSITDMNGNTTYYSHNNMGRVTSITSPNNENTWLDTHIDWNYSSGYLVLTETRCDLNEDKTECISGSRRSYTQTTYDGMLRPTLTQLHDVDNSKNRYQNRNHSWHNQLTFESYWSTNTTETAGISHQYDALQRRWSTTTSGGGTVTKDYLSNNRIKVTDAESNEITTSYLAYGEPSYSKPTAIESEESVMTSMVYNVYGNLSAITQSGLDSNNEDISQTEFRAYDTNQYLCKVVRADVGTTVFSNNTLGEIEWKAQGVGGGLNTNCISDASSANKVKFTYDNLGSSWKTNYPDSISQDVTYTYDANGNLINLVAGSSVSQNYRYNSLNLLDYESLIIAGKSLSVDYEFDNQGALNALTYPDGSRVTYMPNGFGEPTQAIRDAMDDEAAFEYAKPGIIYYPNGIVRQFRYGNGVIHSTTLDYFRKLPSRIEDSTELTTVVDYRYEYDNNANVTKITDGLDSTYSLTNLSYDGLDRLIATTGGSNIGNSSISYDGLGNITNYSSKNSDLTYTYNYTKNSLTSVSDTGSNNRDYTGFTYDDRGNVTSNSYNNFTFNRANQLCAATANATNCTYLYDGYNRRVKHTDTNGTSYSLYGQNGTLLYRETEDGSINYIYLGKKLIAKDGYNIPTTSNQHYRPYGSSIEGESDDVGFTGHKFDSDLGLSYMQARYYDPVIGRFYSNDPVGFRDVHTFNRYAYANNNPYKYIDPNGKSGQFFYDQAVPEEEREQVEKMRLQAWRELIAWSPIGLAADGIELTYLALTLPGGDTSGDKKLIGIVSGELAERNYEAMVETLFSKASSKKLKWFSKAIGYFSGKVVDNALQDSEDESDEEGENQFEGKLGHMGGNSVRATASMFDSRPRNGDGRGPNL